MPHVWNGSYLIVKVRVVGDGARRQRRLPKQWRRRDISMERRGLKIYVKCPETARAP